MPNMRIGFLPQEPQLDPEQDRARSDREKAWARCSTPSRSSRRSTPRTPNPTPTSTSSPPSRPNTKPSSPRAGARHRRADGDRRRRAAPAAVGREDRQTCPAARSGASRFAACCLSKPDMLLLDEPTNHLDAESVEWLEQFLQQFPGHGDGGHPRSLLPRQRRGMDPRARPRARHSMERQLQLVARAEGAAPADRGEAGVRAHQGDAHGARVGAHQSPRAGRRRARRVSRGSRSFPATSTRSATRRRRSSSRSPSASAIR